MTIVQQPQSACFASMMDDFIIDSDASINFVAKYGTHTLLDENYAPDGDRRIIVRRLGVFCRMALWGLWYNGAATEQSYLFRQFDFYIDGTLVCSSNVYFASMATKKNISSLLASGGFLTRVMTKVTRTDVPEYLTAIIPANVAVTAVPYKGGVASNSVTVRASSSSMSVVTMDVSFATLFAGGDYDKYDIVCGEEFTFLIDKTTDDGYEVMRYKNLFDCPETVIFRGLLTHEGDTTVETAEIDGETRRATVRPNDNFTLDSGSFFLVTDYLLYHDLVNAMQISLLRNSSWIAVIINKYTFKRYKRKTFEEISMNISAANPENETLIC